jgi:hypothetical protein
MEVLRRSHTIPKAGQDERKTLLMSPIDMIAPRLAEERVHKVLKTYKSGESMPVRRMPNTPKIIKATCMLSNASLIIGKTKPLISDSGNKSGVAKNVRRSLLLG